MNGFRFAKLTFVLLIGISIYLSFGFFSRKSTNELRVAFLIGNSLRDLKIDPVSVSFAKEANLVLALYGRIIEFNDRGDLVPSMVKKFSINNNEIIFEGIVRQQLKSGALVSFDDFEFSLKRLLILNKNTHGKLADMLLEDPNFRTINDTHRAIKRENDKISLVVRHANYAKFLLPLFANVDFSVVPREAVDIKDPNLKIMNYENTSGAYRLFSETPSVFANLEKNISENAFYTHSASNIKLLESGFNEVDKKFFNNEVDVVPMIYQITHDAVNKVMDDKSLSYFETLPIRVWYIDFFKNKTKLESSQHSAIKIIREGLPYNEFEYGFERSNELFPKNGLASLSREQKARLDESSEENQDKNIKPVKVWVPEKKIELFKENFKYAKNIDFYFVNKYPPLLPLEEQPDAMIIAMDSSANEDLSLLSYCFSFKQIKMNEIDQREWMLKYIQMEKIEDRVTALRELHLKILLERHVVPLGFSPYVALARNGWKLNLSKFSAGTPLWRISKN